MLIRTFGEREVAFREDTEPDHRPRHSPQINNKGIRKRGSTLSATNLAKKALTPAWPPNAVFDAAPV